MDIIGLQATIQEQRIEWRKHVLQRLAERNILQSEVLKVLLAGELIEDYPDDKPFPRLCFLHCPKAGRSMSWPLLMNLIVELTSLLHICHHSISSKMITKPGEQHDTLKH